jgi:hypothetical protein
MSEDYFISRMSDLIRLAHDAPSGRKILNEIVDIGTLLLNKNIAYGNSALEPIRIFSKADAGEQLDVRIDDKLSRIMRGEAYKDENDIVDLVGYLVLKLIYDKDQREKESIEKEKLTPEELQILANGDDYAEEEEVVEE